MFIDSSTTCLHLIQFLSHFKGIRAITNGLMSAVTLADHTSARVSVLAGNIVNKRATINGSKTYHDILTYNADIAFISCTGLDFKNSTTDVHEAQAAVKHAFRRRSENVVLLATQDKFNSTYMYNSMNLSDID